MSLKIMAAVWEESTHRGAALIMMLALADHANDDGVSWPGIDRLAQRARVSVRQAQVIIAALIESGELHVLRNAGRGYTNLYLVTIGHTATSLTTVLTQRFQMTPDEARRMAHAILKKRPQEKGEAGNTFSYGKGEVSRRKGEVSREKGAVLRVKGEVATAPEPINQLTLTEPKEEPGDAHEDTTARAFALWDRTRNHLRLQLPRATFETYLRDTVAFPLAPDVYRIECLTPEHAEFLRKRLSERIVEALADTAGQPISVEFTARQAPGLLL
jgi:hypothetical protein